MSGFAATSGKFEIFAPGNDTQVMFNDNNDINAISTLAFTKGTGTLSATILATATLSHDSGDLTIKTCLLYTSPSPRDLSTSRMPSSA